MMKREFKLELFCLPIQLYNKLNGVEQEYYRVYGEIRCLRRDVIFVVPLYLETILVVWEV